MPKGPPYGGKTTSACHCMDLQRAGRSSRSIPPGTHVNAYEAYDILLETKELGDYLLPLHEPALPAWRPSPARYPTDKSPAAAPAIYQFHRPERKWGPEKSGKIRISLCTREITMAILTSSSTFPLPSPAIFPPCSGLRSGRRCGRARSRSTAGG